MKPAWRRWYRDPDYGKLPPTPEQKALIEVYEREIAESRAQCERIVYGWAFGEGWKFEES